jgi:disease resistance protein RPM1
MVSTNKNNDDKVKVVSVVGFGGLGKTTLAAQVCRQLEGEFQCQALVSVSQAFGGKDLKGLLKRVLQQVVKPKGNNPEGMKEEDLLGGIDEMNEVQLTHNLNKVLKVIRYTYQTHTSKLSIYFYLRITLPFTFSFI